MERPLTFEAQQQLPDGVRASTSTLARSLVSRPLQNLTLEAALGEAQRALVRCERERDQANERVAELTLALNQALSDVLRADHDANHDPLTGLPNRRLLLDRLNLAIAQADRTRAPVAVLFLDLVGFKDVNDCLGHAAGDAVLVRVARALTSSIRAGDTAARIGGDEFVIVLPNFTQEQSIARIAAEIRARLNFVQIFGNATVTVAASVGAALYPTHGSSSAELLRYADRAMYESRTRRRVYS